MEELEHLALQRLRLLKSADNLRNPTIPPTTTTSTTTTSTLKGGGKVTNEDIKNTIRQAEREYGFLIPTKYGPDREEAILKDEASHFVVRLALCREIEYRNWFLKRECELFMTRLEGSGVDFALRILDLVKGPLIQRVGGEEMEEVRVALDAVSRGGYGGWKGGVGGDGERYYKVPFEEVPGLVRSRRVYVKGGWAYVPMVKLLDVVAAHFRSRLNKSLAVAAKAVGYAESDERMKAILNSVRAHHTAGLVGNKRDHDYTGATGPESVNLHGLVDSIGAMPLCMRNMMERLRTEHHMKYKGRLILGAFLKGCGLTMEESLQFWKTEFGKGQINADKFQKQYAYNIRHQYGKEGKRKSLNPYSCSKVINDQPGPGEHHGCPYREFSEDRLKVALRRMGVAADAMEAIVAHAKDGNYNVACGMCFNSSQPRPTNPDEEECYIPEHPNDYFIRARRRQKEASMVQQGELRTNGEAAGAQTIIGNSPVSREEQPTQEVQRTHTEQMEVDATNEVDPSTTNHEKEIAEVVQQ